MGPIKGPVVSKISCSSFINETSLEVPVWLKENPKDHTYISQGCGNEFTCTCETGYVSRGEKSITTCHPEFECLGTRIVYVQLSKL